MSDRQKVKGVRALGKVRQGMQVALGYGIRGAVQEAAVSLEGQGGCVCRGEMAGVPVGNKVCKPTEQESGCRGGDYGKAQLATRFGCWSMEPIGVCRREPALCLPFL